MATTPCGFESVAGASGQDLLVFHGPTLWVNVGFDPAFVSGNPAAPPNLPAQPLAALVDTGATESCIDSTLAMALNLPIVDRRPISGVHGANEVNVHMAQVLIPTLGFTLYGPFCAVDLSGGGQVHSALIGRTFLQHFTMTYEGRTGTVKISNDP